MKKKTIQGKSIKRNAKAKIAPVKGTTRSAFSRISAPYAAGGLLAVGVASYLIWRNREAIKSTLSEVGEKIPKLFGDSDHSFFGKGSDADTNRTTNPDAYL